MTGDTDQLAELREHVRLTTEALEALMADPATVDELEGVELAWLKEHLEHLLEQTRELQVDIELTLAERGET